MEKLLIITYYWPPSGGPGVQRWLKFAGYLKEAGYDPFILTVDPQQATYPVSDQSLQEEVPSGLRVFHTSTREPYSLYKRFTGRKQVPYSGFTNESGKGFMSVLSRFIRGNLFIPDARRGWNAFALSRARDLILKFDIRIVITTSPPHSSQLIGLKLKKEFPHIHWIADLRDPWTDIFYYDKMLHLPFVKAIDQKLEKKVLQNADKVITVSHFLKENFIRKVAGTQSSKFSVIHNGFDEKDFAADIQPLPGKDHVKMVYTGTLTDEYDLTGLVDALDLVKDEMNFTLQFTGSTTLKWKSLLENQFPGRCTFHPHTDHRSAIMQMRTADILLLVIPDMAQNEGIITGKIFEYMASGKRILGIGPPGGDAASILNATRTGEMFSYQDVKGILKWLGNHDKGQQPDYAAIQQYSRKQLTQRLIQLF
jgi:glycosyltransferase involved in cell wall biosynthesis